MEATGVPPELSAITTESEEGSHKSVIGVCGDGAEAANFLKTSLRVLIR